MKILVPTDFSNLSIVAVNYAIKMANKIDAELLLLHVINLDTHANPLVSMKSNMILKAMRENAEMDFQKLILGLQKLNSDTDRVSHHTIEGNRTAAAIVEFAYAQNASFIVLGSKGDSGISKVLMGGIASSVISLSKLPVIAVPEHARFREINTLVYSSDLEDVQHEINTITTFASLFNAVIHIVHVDSKGAYSDAELKQKEADLKAACDYGPVVIKIFRDSTITDALEKYIDDTDADMLAMFTHKLTFFESLFGKSVTREMTFHTNVPLLAIKK